MMSDPIRQAKEAIYMALCEMETTSLSAEKRWAAYHEALGMYVCRRLSKSELDIVVVRALGPSNIRKHNALVLALLSDGTRRARRVRQGTGVAATWSKVFGDDDSDDDDIIAFQKRWRDADLAATAPRPHPGVKPHAVPSNARLAGPQLVALKMDDISSSIGLDGVSASAVHLMTIAVHAYARRAIAQCRAELRDDGDGGPVTNPPPPPPPSASGGGPSRMATSSTHPNGTAASHAAATEVAASTSYNGSSQGS